jgi:hypothetical protein
MRRYYPRAALLLFAVTSWLAGCDWILPADYVQPGVGLVENFERGPAPESVAPECVQSYFAGQKPPDGAKPCDWPGVTPRGCRATMFCEGCENAGICPDYLFRDGPAEGDYALRLHAWLDGAVACTKNTAGDAFAGLLIWMADGAAPADSRCPTGTPLVDVSRFQSLEMTVRLGDPRMNLMVALQDYHSGSTAVETSPKIALLPSGDNPSGQWRVASVDVCELLKVDQRRGLDPRAIAAVVLTVGRSEFERIDAYVAGQPRQIDIDDVRFVPCPDGGCRPCP